MLVAVAAGKGSPGVTTAAVALALGWPGASTAVVAECDPWGADLPWQARGRGGVVLDRDRGVTSLAGAVRVDGGLTGGAVLEHAQVLEGGLRVLVGPAGVEQSAAIGPAWGGVAAALAACGVDVVADVGRLTRSTPAAPVVAAADLVVLVVRPRVEAVAHLRQGLVAAAGMVNAAGRGSGLERVAVVVVDESSRPGSRRASRRSVEEVLASTPGLGDVATVGVLAWDPRSAAALAGRGRMPARSRLLGSARECAEGVVDRAVRTGWRSVEAEVVVR